MNILVFGAGVLGSLYAVRLKAAGHRVRVLARGRRLEDLKRFGLALQDTVTDRRTFSAADTVDRLGPDDNYDLVLVTVRRTQLAGVLPDLSANRRVPSVLFMVYNAAGPADLVAALGPRRVLLGYAGAGGSLCGPVVRYADVPRVLQKTVIGELDGRTTARLRAIRKALREAGFPTSLSANMDAWLKTHAAWVVPVALALYREGGDPRRLAAAPRTLRLMVRGLREAMAALEKRGSPTTGPLWVRIQAHLPAALLAALWGKVMRTAIAGTAIAAHANNAHDEMELVGADLRALIGPAGLPTPALDELFAAARLGDTAPVRTS